MKHYDKFGNPTRAHERLVERSMALADKVLAEGYISKITADFTEPKRGVKVTMEFLGKTVRRNGKDVVKVLPSKINPARNKELVEYMLDVVEMVIGRRVTGFGCALTYMRDNSSLYIGANNIRDVFYVKKG